MNGSVPSLPPFTRKAAVRRDPPGRPGAIGTCALVGNHGDMKGSGFGSQIDAADAVIRLNDAPTKYVAGTAGRRCVALGVRERTRP